MARRALFPFLFGALTLLFALAPVVLEAQYTFQHFAGSTGGAGHYDGSLSAARFTYPAGLSVDASGNIYVASTGSHTIRKITPAGLLTTVAGAALQSGEENGSGSNARFCYPRGIAVDAAGTIYVADTNNHTIRKITSAGVVATLAGTPGLQGNANGSGSNATFRAPEGLAVDGSGNVYVADTNNHTIRKVTAAGMVTTLAGAAEQMGSADGTGSSARFKYPRGLAIDASGDLYVADSYNNTIRKVTAAGQVTTIAGSAEDSGSANGPPAEARFSGPTAVAVGGTGIVYVAEATANRIRKITVGVLVETLAGSAWDRGSIDGTGSDARFAEPSALVVGGDGNLYVADTANNTIRKITPAGVVTTPYGNVAQPGSADGTGDLARFDTPAGVAVDGSGNAYVADLRNYTIRKITSDGVVTTLAGSAGQYGSSDGSGSAARFYGPMGVAVDGSGNVYVADFSAHTIRKITPAGVVTTIAGATGQAGSADGNGSSARFFNPTAVAVSDDGVVYVADTVNCTIRKIAPDGEVSTLAGAAQQIGSADGIGSEASFNNPWGVAVDGSGNVYVADTGNYTIRKITPAGEVSTLAGSPGSYGAGDGNGSEARFDYPHGVSVDGSGNVYVADTYNYMIRKITPAGVVTTSGGNSGKNGNMEGTGNGAYFTLPRAIAVDGAGTLYVADGGHHAIEVGRPTSLADSATIDAATGVIGEQRQLGVSPQTGTSFSWRPIRIPASSDGTGVLSATDVANPTFTPDGTGRWEFLLRAEGAAGVRYSTVALEATGGMVDPNGDGALGVTDVFYLINHLFAGGPPPVGGVGDMNGDGLLNVADIFYLINHLFAGGPPPV